MTQREFLENVISYVDGTADVDENALKEKANELIASIEKKNEKRISADSKEKKETSARRFAVLSVLSANAGRWFSREEIVKVLDGVTPAQVTAACTSLVKNGFIQKTELKVGKIRKMVYAVPLTEETESEVSEDVETESEVSEDVETESEETEI